MTIRRFARSFAVAAAGLALASCGGGGSSPTAMPTPVAVTSPTPAPTPTPDFSTTLPPGFVCSSPTPPPILRMQIKIHAQEGTRIVLDSKPVVPNVDHYCDKVGFGDWKFCDTRPEGNPERPACDYLAVGRAQDTGRWGPTWYYGDALCSAADITKCANHPTEQFMAIAKAAGTYQVCSSPDRPVDPDGYRCAALDIP